MSRRPASSAALAVLALAVLFSGALLGPAASAATGRDGARPAPPPRMGHGEARAALERVQHLLVPARHRNARAAAPRSTDVSLAMRDLANARPSLVGADRRAADAFLARPTAAEIQDIDVFDYSPVEMATLKQTCNDLFCVTYTTAVHQGMYKNVSTGEVLDNHATAAEAQAALDALQRVYATEVGALGFRPPISDAATADGTFNNRDGKFDVYLTNIGAQGLYGYCAPDSLVRQSSAYCVLDNDFARSQFGADPARSRNVTAAHEFFHAIQYAYDVYEADWFMEGSAVWMEDEVFPAINDYRQYVPASPIRRPLTPFTTNKGISVYGAFTIFKFLAGYLRDRSAVREAWERAAARPGNNSLPALDATFRAHHRSTRLAYSTFGAWNTLVPRGYPEAGAYRPAGAWRVKTLTRKHRSTGTWHLRVGRLANAPVVLRPAKNLPKRTKLRIRVNAPYLSVGGAATLQVRYRNGKVSLQQFGLDRRGDRTRTVGFNPRKVSSVVVVLTNADRTSSGPWSRAFSINAQAR